jgi:predicted TIM-barrel fold metal-dependent hydrolase
MFDGMRVVDAWVNHNPPELAAEDWSSSPAVSKLFSLFPETATLMVNGTTDQQMVDLMDASGIDVAVLSSYSYTATIKQLLEACEAVAETCRTYPGRFVGSARLECLIKDGPSIREGVAAVERIVEEYGFPLVRIMPAMAQVELNQARYYGIYSACAELGVAVGLNVGIPGPLWPARYQRVDFLDEVCIDFPELTVVAAHMGNPWTEELLSFMYKHPNLHLMTSAWTPRRYPARIVDAISSRGFRERIMFATDFPILTFSRSMGEVANLDIDDEARPLFLGGNAARLFIRDDG